MGWTSFYNPYYYPGQSAKKRNEVILNWFCESWKNDHSEILKVSLVDYCVYAAMKNKKTGEVWAAVCKIDLRQINGDNFAYKEMTENVGPCEVACPLSILKLLTPTEHEWANEWRENVKKYHAEKKAKAKNKQLIDTTSKAALIDYMQKLNWNEKTVQRVKERLKNFTGVVRLTKSSIYFYATHQYEKVKNKHTRSLIFKFS